MHDQFVHLSISCQDGAYRLFEYFDWQKFLNSLNLVVKPYHLN